LANNPYLDLDYSGYHGNLIQQLFIINKTINKCKAPLLGLAKSEYYYLIKPIKKTTNQKKKQTNK